MPLPTEFQVLDHGEKRRIACGGGVYSNWYALTAFLDAVRDTPKEDTYCLGDLTGGFGLYPERALIALRKSRIQVLQGNRDYTVGHGEEECGCGYTSARDNHFAQISFDLSRRGVGEAMKAWLRALPHQVSLRLGDRRVRLCHGSPRSMNEFLWESLSDDFYRELLESTGVDVIVCTHSGLQWTREVAPGKWIVNCGVLGKPPNDGSRNVWYAVLEAGRDPELVPLEYDWMALATEMERGGLPDEFVIGIREGWWACCSDILPPQERARGKYSSRTPVESDATGDAACCVPELQLQAKENA
jgi:predicted phosphodiesterase